MQKRAPACNVRETRELLADRLEDWADDERGPLPAWAKVIAREARVRDRDAAPVDVEDRWELARELTEQVLNASSGQVCGYGFVWHKYTGEGRRFRRRLARTKLAGMRRRRSR